MLHIENGTALDVTVVVDQDMIGVFQPGTQAEVPIAVVPSVARRVEARSPSGRALTAMQIEGPENTFGRVDLTCGRLTIWVGSSRPMGPAPDPSSLVECEPSSGIANHGPPGVLAESSMCCHSSIRCPSGPLSRANLPVPSASAPTVTGDVSTPASCSEAISASMSSTR